MGPKGTSSRLQYYVLNLSPDIVHKTVTVALWSVVYMQHKTIETSRSDVKVPIGLSRSE